LRRNHHFSVDVEEYFHASALEEWIPQARWDDLSRRSPERMQWLLDVLEAREVKGTFFILGWLAEREPAMVRAIAGGGHEIASHGWDHRRVTSLTPEEFRDDVTRSKALLEDLTGCDVLGYRAPSFSILPGFEWALDVLLEAGFVYDSSMFPVRIHPWYGYPAAPRDPHIVPRDSGSLVEIPPATLKVGGLNLPAAGGAYLRFFPLSLVRAGLASAGKRGQPGTLYLHPWELDTDMPDIPAPWKTRLRMKGGIGNMARRVSALLHSFDFCTMRETAMAVRKAARLAG
jgi:polysaccharide deacetylase family protein (PEP-CTERM system associated)